MVKHTQTNRRHFSGLAFKELIFKTKVGKETKTYILLFTYSLIRTMHLQLLPNQSRHELIMTLKSLIARRGRPAVISSDNAKNFVAPLKCQ